MTEQIKLQTLLNENSINQIKLINKIFPDFDINPIVAGPQELTVENLDERQCIVDSKSNIIALSFLPEASESGYKELFDLLATIELPYLRSIAFFNPPLNPIESISNFSTLTHLTIVDQSFDIVIENLNTLSIFRDLEHLNLTRTSLLSIKGIEHLTKLKYLYLGGTQIVNIDELKYLSKLKSFAFWETRVSNISALTNNIELEEIYLQDTDVKTLEPLLAFKRLKTVSAINCKIESISECLLTLGLSIKTNHLETSLSDRVLELNNNPITFPPKEILTRGNEITQAYFDSLHGEKGKLNEAKLILVGEGAAGKTSLIRRFIDNDFNPYEDKTDGISIKPWTVDADDDGNEKIKIHCWDFGGQEIMRATHQLFLSERSVYLIVLDIRKDENSEHWLKQVMAVSNSSPIIVVLNKCDEQFDDNIAKQMLKEKYPNIYAFHKVSCQTNEGIEKLKLDVIKQISKLGMRQFIIAQNWLKVKKELESLKVARDYISYQIFIDLCSKYAINDSMVQDILLTLLHDLGLVIHFKGLEELQTQVLNPKWITEGIYTLLNSDKLSKQHGIISKKESEAILEESFACKKYRGKSSYLMQVMEQFELCYQVPSANPKAEVRYLIPDLLPIELNRNPKLNDGIEFIYKYKGYMPPELMARFIVKSHTLQKPNHCWRYGALLKCTSFNSQALVTVDKEEREIKIVVSDGEKRSFLAVIRNMFTEIHKSYLAENIGLEIFLPLKCQRTGRTSLLPYATLIKKEKRIWQGIEADNQFDYKLDINYSVSRLLDGIESKHIRQREFKKDQGTTVNNINVNASPVISQTVNQDSHQVNEQQNSQNTDVAISIQLQSFTSLLRDWNEEIIEDLSDSLHLDDGPESMKLLPRAQKEIDRVDVALADIQSIEDKQEANKKLSKFVKVQSFIENCMEGTNKVGELMKKTGEGLGKLQTVGKEYNKIATKFGFQVIPTILLGE